MRPWSSVPGIGDAFKTTSLQRRIFNVEYSTTELQRPRLYDCTDSTIRGQSTERAQSTDSVFPNGRPRSNPPSCGLAQGRKPL